MRLRLHGAADGFTFNHEGELVESGRSELVALIGPRKARLRIAPRVREQEFPVMPGMRRNERVDDRPSRPRTDVVDFRVSDDGFIATFDYDEGAHPYRDIAVGMATVRFYPDLIDVTAYDHSSATPTDDHAPMAP